MEWIFEMISVMLAIAIFINIMSDSYNLLIKKKIISRESYLNNAVMILLNQEFLLYDNIRGTITIILIFWYIFMLAYSFLVSKKNKTGEVI